MSNAQRDILDAEAIRRYVAQHTSAAAEHLFQDAALSVFDSVTSTNDVIRDERFAQGAQGSVVIAGEQTKGRGQRGRAFYSPSESGLYVSMRLVCPLDQDISWVTMWVSLCVTQTLKAITHVQPAIKWVNDIYLEEKKVSGILCESYIEHLFDYANIAGDTRSGEQRVIIIGVGINAYEPEGGFPENLAQKAGAISEHEVPNLRNTIAGTLICQLFNTYAATRFLPGVAEALEAYQSMSNLIGRHIAFEYVQDQMGTCDVPAEISKLHYAAVLDISDDLDLIIQLDSGVTKPVRSGSIRITQIL